MARLKGKYKGKTGKIDIIEDIIGTEPLSGTYEGRKQNWKNIQKEKLFIEELRKKKLEEYKKKHEDIIRDTLQDQQKYNQILQKINFLLPFLLTDDAYMYISTLRYLEPNICKRIMHYLFQPDDIRKLDLYVETIRRRGYGPKKRIALNTIIKIERKVKNIKPKIEVERDGKRETFQEKIGARKIA